jgi:hypothetical protein
MTQAKHPGKKHIRIDCPNGDTCKVWAEQNRDRIKSFLLKVEVVGLHNTYLDVWYDPGQETLIIEEVLRYAGVVGVCRHGSYLD